MSNEELESMFDCEGVSTFEQILNLSQWDIHDTVTMKNKNLLISTVLFEELVGKREKEIKSFAGKILQSQDQIKEHAKLFKTCFVYSKHQLCGNDLINLTKLDELKGKVYDNVSEWLAQFLSELMKK